MTAMHVLILDRSGVCYASAISRSEAKAVAAIFDKLEEYFAPRGYAEHRKRLKKYRKTLTVKSLSHCVYVNLSEHWELFHLKDTVIV